MIKDSLIQKIETDCPICDKTHILDKRKGLTQAIVKGEVVNYEEIYYFCPLTNSNEAAFVTSKMMDDNLLRARDSYRKCNGLLTSIEIKEIRDFYELTQKEFATIFGWGEVTVTRYESKTIQDETYDNIMRMAYENPLFVFNNLVKHESRFTEHKFREIKKKIVKRIEEMGVKYFKLQEIYSLYAKYNDESYENGYKKLDIDKLSCVVGFFAENVQSLYKVKLMKLLWYADVLHFRRYGKSLTGLVYKHMMYGALPLAYNEIIYLPSVKVKESIIYDEISYEILPNKNISTHCLSQKEIDILKIVSEKFYDYTSREIVAYMHKEKAYIETEPFKIISYELAKDLNELR